MRKIYLTILIILFLLAWFKNSLKVSPYFQVIFLDVGQGDSSLIITPQHKVILIDGGPDQKVLKELGRVLPFWNRKIDLLVVTHPHDDHFVGLIEVLRRYQVEKIIIDQSVGSSDTWRILVGVIKEEKRITILPKQGQEFDFGGACLLNILSSHNKKREDENDYSVITKFSCLGRNVLLTGDASQKVEQELLNSETDLKADIFKASHHGSQTANSESFVAAISPRLAVISVGLDNKFKHPNLSVLEIFKKMSVDIYQTALGGSKHFLANNNEIIIKN